MGFHILAHRGLWNTHQERNCLAACTAALRQGFSLETDIRDRQGQLVVAHDMEEPAAYPLRDLLACFSDYPAAWMAINMKSGGLNKHLSALLAEYRLSRYFIFDMAIPDMIECLTHGLQVFTRQSEYESTPVCYDQSCGIWLDMFKEDWVTAECILAHMQAGKHVAVASPELHRRSYLTLWQQLKAAMALHAFGGMTTELFLCTDHPQEARAYFDA